MLHKRSNDVAEIPSSPQRARTSNSSMVTAGAKRTAVDAGAAAVAQVLLQLHLRSYGIIAYNLWNSTLCTVSIAPLHKLATALTAALRLPWAQ